MFKFGDTVRLLDFLENHPNGYAMVQEEKNGFVRVTNTNMPFMGTFSLIDRKKFPVVRVKKM